MIGCWLLISDIFIDQFTLASLNSFINEEDLQLKSYPLSKPLLVKIIDHSTTSSGVIFVVISSSVCS